jgi:hypothetical protein
MGLKLAERGGKNAKKRAVVAVTAEQPQSGERRGVICISASFGPSTVRVNTETVYSGRREAGVVMTSIGHWPGFGGRQGH